MVRSCEPLGESPCPLHFLRYSDASSSFDPIVARPRRPSPATWTSVLARSDTCSSGLATQPTPRGLLIGPGRAVPPKTIRSEPGPWRCGSYTRPGERARSASVWPRMPTQRPCPANAPCSDGPAASGTRPWWVGDGRRPPSTAPPPRMTPGRWTPWSSCARPMVKASAGCGWSMNTRVLSWAPRLSPRYDWAHVPEADVQWRLRAAFERRGLPRQLRVDNGKPWGSRSDLPPVLALWLIGLGVAVNWNDPCCPQQNGVVERSQGTAKRWAEPHACRDPAELQVRLDADDLLQRERYPVAGGRSRRELFPELAHSGRPTGRWTRPARGAWSECATTWRSAPCRVGWIARGRFRYTTGTSMWV